MTNWIAFFEALLTIGAVMIPVATGWAAWNIVAKATEVQGVQSICGAAISVGCAIASHALLCHAMLVVGIASPASIIFCDLILMLVVLAVSGTREGRQQTESAVATGKNRGAQKWIASFRLMPIANQLGWALFAIVIMLVVVFVSFRVGVSPMGDWDAWIIWNTKARLFYLSPERWVEPLRSFDWWRHPDYPLTHSASVARVWFWAGETRLAPILVGLQYSILCVMLVVSAVAHFRNALVGVAAGMILLASPVYQETFWAQCADGPLAFFMLASGVALTIGSRSSHRSQWWLLAGVAAGLATAIKNEGLAWWGILAFAMGIFSLLITKDRTVLRRFWLWLGISVVFVGITLGTKFWIGSENDLLQSDREWMMYLVDLNRHGDVAETMAMRWLGVLPDAAREPGATKEAQAIGFGAAAFFALMVVLLAGKFRKPRQPEVVVLTISLFVFAAVCHIVFVLTPHDLSWHLFSAAHRVVAQMWPLSVLLCFVWGADDRNGAISEGMPTAST